MKKWLVLVALGAVMVAIVAPVTAGAQYSPSYITTSVASAAEGDPFTVNAGYFDPGSEVRATFNSTPVDLGTMVVPASRVVSGSFTVPVGVGPGPHTVQLSGTSDGESMVLTSALEVVSRAQPAAPASAAPAPAAPAPSSVSPVVATPAFTG